MKKIQLLERHFDTALDTPDGIKRLRELILSLAMKGKLVAQDAKDQPASELLKEIEKEKVKLVKDGKIKKQESLSAIKPEEIPYELPKGWEWIKLQSISEINGGFAFKSSHYVNDGVRVVRISDFNENGFIDNNIVRYKYSSALDQFRLYENNIIIAMTGGTVGKSLLVRILKEEMVVNQRVATIKVEKQIEVEYIYNVIRSKLIKQLIQERKNSTNDNISMQDIQSFPIPLPPLAEQKRIVEKIDQLMTLCDKLEAERNARDNKRISVHTAAVNRLLGASEKPAFDKSWSFITKNFNELYSVIENVAELKKAILQLAVMGKLVPQDRNDQPAIELLREIDAEKARLVKEGRIKKQDALPPIKPGEIPYQVPEGWVWCRLNDIFDVRDGTHDTPKYISSGIPLITSKNFKDGEIDFDSAKFISEKDHRDIKQRSFVEKYDILFSMIGGNIGNMVMVNTDREFSIKNVALFKYYNRELTTPDYLMLYLKHVSYSIQDKAAGGAQPFVSLTFLRSHLFPLPPLAEQKRIVAKIDQLMELCNSLEQGIKVATEKRSRVLGAVLARV